MLVATLVAEGESFQETDRRGDTPLHAAACNGSAECCRMLLDLAVEPGVRNKKGLRPIDLAIKRRHQDCEQVRKKMPFVLDNREFVFRMIWKSEERKVLIAIESVGDEIDYGVKLKKIRGLSACGK